MCSRHAIKKQYVRIFHVIPTGISTTYCLPLPLCQLLSPQGSDWTSPTFGTLFKSIPAWHSSNHQKDLYGRTTPIHKLLFQYPTMDCANLKVHLVAVCVALGKKWLATWDHHGISFCSAPYVCGLWKACRIHNSIVSSTTPSFETYQKNSVSSPRAHAQVPHNFIHYD